MSAGFTLVVAELSEFELELEPQPAANATVANATAIASHGCLGIATVLNMFSFESETRSCVRAYLT